EGSEVTRRIADIGIDGAFDLGGLVDRRNADVHAGVRGVWRASAAENGSRLLRRFACGGDENLVFASDLRGRHFGDGAADEVAGRLAGTTRKRYRTCQERGPEDDRMWQKISGHLMLGGCRSMMACPA